MSHFGRRSDFLSVDYNDLRRQQQQGAQQAASTRNDRVPDQLIKAARASGVMNLANKDLTHLPPSVFRVILDAGNSGDLAMDNKAKENWWEFQEIRKLLISDNRLQEIPEDIKLLPYIAVIEARDNALTDLPDSISELKELRIGNFAKNKLTSLPTSLCECGTIASLNLSANQIDRVPSTVRNLRQLVDLDLSQNRLMLLPAELSELESLRTLNLENNMLTTLPDNLGQLSGLVSLNLNKNKIAHISWSSNSFPNLEVFEASENQLGKFPFFRNATTLKVIKLSHNLLSSVPAEYLTPLVALKHLDLRCNKLTEIPSAIAELQDLERLDLTDNALTSLPFELGTMPTLKAISVEGNALKGIRFDIVAKGTEALKKHLACKISQPEEFEYKPAIQTTMQGTSGIVGAVVDIDINEVRSTKIAKYNNKRLGYIPDCIIDSLREVFFNKIEISFNELPTIPEALMNEPFAEHIDHLTASHNQIGFLDSRISFLTNMTMLDLSVNFITDLPREMSSLRKLRELNLTRNSLTFLPSVVYELHNLENLLLSSNKIEEIDPIKMRGLPRLLTLDLSNNNLKQVPPELGLCTQLKSLMLEGNAFRVPRQAVLCKGTGELLEYLRNRIAT